jgi:hypothetical protein
MGSNSSVHTHRGPFDNYQPFPEHPDISFMSIPFFLFPDPKVFLDNTLDFLYLGLSGIEKPYSHAANLALFFPMNSSGERFPYFD